MIMYLKNFPPVFGIFEFLPKKVMYFLPFLAALIKTYWLYAELEISWRTVVEACQLSSLVA